MIVLQAESNPLLAVFLDHSIKFPVSGRVMGERYSYWPPKIWLLPDRHFSNPTLYCIYSKIDLGSKL